MAENARLQKKKIASLEQEKDEAVRDRDEAVCDKEAAVLEKDNSILKEKEGVRERDEVLREKEQGELAIEIEVDTILFLPKALDELDTIYDRVMTLGERIVRETGVDI